MPVPAPAPPNPLDYPAQLAWANGELKKWAAFGVDQTRALGDANGRTSDTIAIIERCEARDAAALKAARPKVLGLF